MDIPFTEFLREEDVRKLPKIWGGRFGATLAIDPLSEDVQMGLDKNRIKNIDTVVECVGLKNTMLDAIRFAGKCSTVVLFGLTVPDCEIPVKPFEIFKKEIKITASYINPYTMSRAVSILQAGAVRDGGMITEILPLDEIEKAFENGEIRRNGKIIIQP